MGSDVLENSELEKALRNTHIHAQLMLEPQIEFPPPVVRKLRDFYESFFDSPPHNTEAKLLALETSAAFQQLTAEVATLAAKAASYPFSAALGPLHEKCKECSGRVYAWYLTDLQSQHDSLLDTKEQVLDPIRKFLAGPQKTIFDAAQAFAQSQQPNFSQIAGDEPARLAIALQDPDCLKGNKIQQLKVLTEGLQAKVAEQVTREVTAARSAVAGLRKRLTETPDFAALRPDQQELITNSFSGFDAGLSRHSLIAVIRDELRRFETGDYQRMLSQVSTWATPVPEELKEDRQGRPEDQHGEDRPPVPVPPKPAAAIEYVPSREIRVAFPKAWLADEADIEQYVHSLRAALLAEIRAGKRIQI